MTRKITQDRRALSGSSSAGSAAGRLERMIRDADAFVGMWPLPGEPDVTGPSADGGVNPAQRCESRSAEGQRPSGGMSSRSVVRSRQSGVSNGLPQ